jgi:hypothetical protein
MKLGMKTLSYCSVLKILYLVFLQTYHTMKSTAFCHVTSSSSLKANRRFGGTFRVRLRGRRRSRQEMDMKADGMRSSRASLLLGLFFDPEHGGNVSVRNVG